MLIEIIFALFLGMLTGTLTGLIPGIHLNLIAALLVSISLTLLNIIDPIFLIVFIASMAITQTFVDFIPSIFLGCPNTDTELSVLPGHELLKKGQGYEAIILTCYGSLAAIFLLVLIAWPSIILISKTYSFFYKLIPYLLVLVSLILILLEKKKLKALKIFLLSGMLGYAVLNLSLEPAYFNEPLLPLLTGFFGASNLILSIKNKTQIPIQKITKPKFEKKFISPLIGALVASPLSSFLPGLGSGQAAIIGNTISKTDRKGFLVLLGATNTLVMGFSFITFYIIAKTRTGATVAISEIIGNISLNVLLLVLIVVLLSGISGFFITTFLARISSQKIYKINYTKISILTLIVLFVVIFLVSKPFGILIAIASTITGIYAISLGVRRTNMMGCLLLPTILFYLF